MQNYLTAQPNGRTRIAHFSFTAHPVACGPFQPHPRFLFADNYLLSAHNVFMENPRHNVFPVPCSLAPRNLVTLSPKEGPPPPHAGRKPQFSAVRCRSYSTPFFSTTFERSAAVCTAAVPLYIASNQRIMSALRPYREMRRTARKSHYDLFEPHWHRAVSTTWIIS